MTNPKHNSNLPSANAMTCLTILGATAATAGALGQTIRFGDLVIYTDTGSSSDLAPGDYDRDAQMDVAVVAGEAVQIYFNDGAGGLVAEVSIPFEYSASDLAVADMDNDGDADLVWVERLTDRSYVMTIWYNDGDGRSGETVQVSLAGKPAARIAIADFNGSGFEDIIFASGARTVSILANNGDRTFEQRLVFTYPVQDHEITTMTVGDFDRDGDPDLSAVFQDIYYGGRRYKIYDTQVALLRNEGGQSLELASQTPLPWEADAVIAWSATAGDLDGDGDLDVALAGWPSNDPLPAQLVFMQNQGGESFGVAASEQISEGLPWDLALGDVNTDGRLDLLLTTSSVRGVYVLRNDGQFTFRGMSPFFSDAVGRIAVADLGHDGQLDLLAAGHGGLARLENLTALRGPILAQSALVRGRVATFVVDGATPGERVEFLYSLTGPGNSVGQRLLGGLTLDLKNPVTVLGSAVAQQSGRAVLHRFVPVNAPLVPVTTQAVIRRGNMGRASVKTPFHMALIEP